MRLRWQLETIQRAPRIGIVPTLRSHATADQEI
jgi:hypothetical protein